MRISDWSSDVCSSDLIIERWIARTPLRADYTRRERRIGQVAHLDEMLRACGDADVIVLAPDAIPAPGWATQLAACFARHASRSEERRVGTVGVSTCSSRWSASHSKKTHTQLQPEQVRTIHCGI